MIKFVLENVIDNKITKKIFFYNVKLHKYMIINTLKKIAKQYQDLVGHGLIFYNNLKIQINTQ